MKTTRPAGTGWLVPRLRTVPIGTGLNVTAATAAVSGKVAIKLNDGSERRVDHVMLATGYRVDITRHSFLAPELLKALHVVDGYPELYAGLESSVPGLHFMGAPAARSFGPLNRFVSGTGYAGSSLARRIVASAGRNGNGH